MNLKKIVLLTCIINIAHLGISQEIKAEDVKAQDSVTNDINKKLNNINNRLNDIDNKLINSTGTTLAVKEPSQPQNHWYEKVSLRGYAQVRYNRLLETNDKLKCEQCDKSWGENGGVFIRRLRLILFGDVHDNVYIYIQPDIASAVSSTNQHFAQLRDGYFDLSLDSEKEFRIRFGQSKIPFGFENMQSSQNRLTLDRSDGINSAVSNERDLGAFFYWAPAEIRKRFSYLVSSGLKGSGDYGVFGIGLYNGQGANKPEANNKQHIVARLTYPFEFKNKQILEPGIQAYSGKYVLPSDLRSSNLKNPKGFDFEFIDERVAATLVLYPQPFGFQIEYNVGRGPEFNKQTDSVEVKKLKGGYALINYMIKAEEQRIIPFIRTHAYKGGKKHELDARSYTVNEHEFGVEWQPNKSFEIVAMYTISERRFEDYVNQDNEQKGKLLRLQFQFNY